MKKTNKHLRNLCLQLNENETAWEVNQRLNSYSDECNYNTR